MLISQLCLNKAGKETVEYITGPVPGSAALVSWEPERSGVKWDWRSGGPKAYWEEA